MGATGRLGEENTPEADMKGERKGKRDQGIAFFPLLLFLIEQGVKISDFLT